MKAKDIQIAQVFANCPHCGGNLYDKDTGSQLLDICINGPDVKYPCEDCGKEFALPERVYK